MPARTTATAREIGLGLMAGSNLRPILDQQVRDSRRPAKALALADREGSPYSPALMQGAASDVAFRHRHLLGIEGLSPEDIKHVLDLADGYVDLNRQAEKKRALVSSVMDRADLKKLAEPDFTVSSRMTPPSLVITVRASANTAKRHTACLSTNR